TSSWAPELLATMDRRYSLEHGTKKLGTGYRQAMSMKPSEYFHRNVMIGSSGMNRDEVEMRHEIGIHNIMWGSDYPHPEGSWPITQEIMIRNFRGVPDDEIERMLGTNAAEFYGFDTEKLLPLAERIGPERSLFRDETAPA
ncbi:MAG: amidohydrolase, partial [Pirellulales bacterium]|nr:amidohydrolase [Pirellulales bacterium]